MTEEPKEQWTDVEERGQSWFFKPLISLHEIGVLNWWTARMLLYPIMTYYFLTDQSLFRASNNYLRRLARCRDVEGLPDRPGMRHSYYHILEFGRSIFDRFAFWLGYRDRYEISSHGEEILFSKVSEDRGAMLLSFHIGNYYLMRYMAMKRGLKVNIVAYWDTSPMVTELLKEANSDSQLNVVRVDPENPQSVLKVKERIDQGELVAILGDRKSAGSSSRTVTVPFLDGTTSLPTGPYFIASILDCPILLTYALRTGPRSYDLHAEEFADDLQLTRKERKRNLRRLAKSFAEKMEEVCCRVPYQWFNFYDFWETSDPGRKKGTGSENNQELEP